jgi:hypothetical protein
LSLIADITLVYQDLSTKKAQLQFDQLRRDNDQWIESVFDQYQDYQYIPDIDPSQQGRNPTARTMTWENRAIYRKSLTQVTQSDIKENSKLNSV